MYLRILRESPARTHLVFTAIIILISGIIVMAVGFIAGLLIYGIGLTEMQAALTDISSPHGLSLLKFFQVIQSIGLFIIPPVVIAYFLHGKPSVYLRYNKIPYAKSILLVIAIVYFSEPLINWLAEVNSSLVLPQWMDGLQSWMKESEEQANKITKAFLETESVSDLFFNIFMIGLLPAIGEELLFRGVIQQLMKKITGNAHMAIWISAILFSALHMQFFGFLPRLLLGAMFGYMLEWSGSLWLPIIAHFVNNATAVVVYYLQEKGMIGKNIEEVGTSTDGTSYLVIISVVFLVVFFRLLCLNYSEVKVSYPESSNPKNV